MIKNRSWKALVSRIVRPPYCLVNEAMSVVFILFPFFDVTISRVTPDAFRDSFSSVPMSTQLSMSKIDLVAERMCLDMNASASKTSPSKKIFEGETRLPPSP